MTTQRGVPTHAHCKMLYILKGGDTPVFLTMKIPSCKNCLKKRLSKVISHLKNAVFRKCACRVVVTGGQIYLTKIVGF